MSSTWSSIAPCVTGCPFPLPRLFRASSAFTDSGRKTSSGTWIWWSCRFCPCPQEPCLPELLAVIAGHDDDRILELAGTLEAGEELSDPGVGVGDVAVVERFGVAHLLLGEALAEPVPDLLRELSRQPPRRHPFGEARVGIGLVGFVAVQEQEVRAARSAPGPTRRSGPAGGSSRRRGRSRSRDRSPASSRPALRR